MQANDRYTDEVRGLADRFQQTLQDSGLIQGDDLLNIKAQLNREVYSLLEAPKPKVLVYGIYNSGKSTLVNALCRKKVAETADRPMTWKTDEYDVGKYVLIDSPGVDAPIEHEQIADAQLTQCHVILFVVSSKGGFESRKNYEKMCRLIQLKIPFYVVLNDRGTEMPKDPKLREDAKRLHRLELNAIKRKIIKNLIIVSGDKHIGDKYEVIDLNAKSAWTGIEKGKSALREASKIGTLEGRLERILEDRGAMQWLQAPLSSLDSSMRTAESKVISLQGNDDYAKKRQRLSDKLEISRQNMILALKDSIGMLRDRAYVMFMDEKNKEPIGDAIIEEVRQSFRGEASKLTGFLKENFQELALQVDGNFQVSYQAPQNNWVPARPSTPPASSIPENSSTSSDNSLLGTILGLFKSKAKKEQEEYEKKLREASLANQANKDRAFEQMRIRQDARAQANAYLDDLQHEVQKIILEEIDRKFSGILQTVDQAVQQEEQISTAAKRLLHDLRLMRSELNSLRQM